MVRPRFIWTLASLLILSMWMLVYGVDMGADSSPSAWLTFVGRFHILILHFPIVCLLVALAAEIGSVLPKLKSLRSVATGLLGVGAISAIAAVVTGTLLAVGEDHQGDLVTRHRLLGFMLASAAVVTFSIRLSGGTKPAKSRVSFSLATLGATGALVVLTAHDGGSLVHGKDYLVAHAPEWVQARLRPFLSPAKSIAIEQEPSIISADLISRYDETIEPVLRRYCFRCHSDEDAKGGIRFDQLGPRFQTAQREQAWEHVRDALATMEMPPKDAKALPVEEREKLLAWVGHALEEVAVAKRDENGSFPMRRLTRREFNATYQDLFAVSAAFTNQLPPDPVSKKGYDTSADSLMISNVDLQLYLETARNALDRYVIFGPQSQGQDRYFFEAEDIYHYCRGIGYLRAMEVAPVPLAPAKLEALKSARLGHAPVFRDRRYGPLPYGDIPSGDVPGVGEGRGFARLHEQFFMIKTTQTVGNVVVRVHAAAERGADGSYPVLRLEAGRSFDQALKTLTAGEYDVMASPDHPGVYEFKFRLEDALPPLANDGAEGPIPYLLFVLSNVARHEYGALAGSDWGQGDIFTDGGLELHPGIVRQTEESIQSGRLGMKRWAEGEPNFLLLDAIEVDILPHAHDPNAPWVVSLPTNSREEAMVARDTLAKFARTAFRRAVTETELTRFITLFDQLREGGSDFSAAMKDAMSAMLVSQPFLFVGRPAPASAAEICTDLASRLSYFIWSSQPDARLIDLAEAGVLNDPRVLAEEVQRMLDDPRTERLAESFARQWLSLDRLKDVVVSSELYPEYDVEFAGLLKRQTLATFADVFSQNRDARDLFRSEEMMLNQQLARHYRLDPLLGSSLRRVKVGPHTKNWGGILTQGSILTINSDGQDSHPIKRGVWLLEKVLNDPPPPPPPVVPEIDESDPTFAALSLKQKIEHHREVHACSGCHGKIDPWGIAFEEYDATGRWRDTINSAHAIDASTVLPDGSHIAGLQELSQYLLTMREDQMMLSLVQHLMVYALGRDLDVFDEREAQSILKSFKASGYNLKHLVLAITQSDAFTQTQPRGTPHV